MKVFWLTCPPWKCILASKFKQGERSKFNIITLGILHLNYPASEENFSLEASAATEFINIALNRFFPVTLLSISFEGGSSRSHCVEESFWRRLWTCRQTEYWVMMMMILSLTYCIAWLAQLYFRNYLVSGMIFGKKSYTYILIWSTSFIWNFVINAFRSSCKVSGICVRF